MELSHSDEVRLEVLQLLDGNVCPSSESDGQVARPLDKCPGPFTSAYIHATPALAVAECNGPPSAANLTGNDDGWRDAASFLCRGVCDDMEEDGQ